MGGVEEMITIRLNFCKCLRESDHRSEQMFEQQRITDQNSWQADRQTGKASEVRDLTMVAPWLCATYISTYASHDTRYGIGHNMQNTKHNTPQKSSHKIQQTSCITYGIRHTSFIIHHTSCIIHHTSYIMHHTSYIIHHTSYIANHIFQPYIKHKHKLHTW